MRILAWVITIINAGFGMNAFLNAVGLLRSGKYGKGATWFVALLFLGLAAWNLYALFSGGSTRQAFWISLAPWMVAIVVMLFTLVLGDWQ